MSDGTPQQRERNPVTFVSEAMTCARELTTPELERIAELTKSSLVDQDRLNAQLFNLAAMLRWPCKRNVLRILLYCAAAGSDGFREHARGNVFWVIGVLLLTSEARQETAEQGLFIQRCVQQYIWRARRGINDDLDLLIRTINDQRKISFHESIVRARSLMQLTTDAGNDQYVLFRLQQSYSVFHAVTLLALQPIPATNGVDADARSISQFPLPVADVLSALIRCILHAYANAAIRERLLEACGDDAQYIMYGLQAALDAHARGYNSFARGPVLLLLQDLSSQTGLLPKEYWLSGIEEGERIGSGGEADIRQGTLLRNSKRELIALRKIQHQAVTKLIFREAITHRQLRHHNILRFLGIFKMETLPGAIITPWVSNGDAFKYMKQNSTPDRFLCVTLGISSAVEYMHLLDPPVIHGDIRAKNILIDTDGTPKLCDFGFSRIKHEITRSQTSIAEGGYMTHMAPELWETEVFRTTPESDVFSFAITIYELGTQSSLFAPITNAYTVVRLIQSRRRPDRPFNLAGLGPSISTHLWALIEKMWEHDPTRRPSATHVHRVLRQIDTEKNHGGAATSTSMPSPPISEPLHIETTEIPSLITSLSSMHISVPPTRQIPSSHVSLPNAVNTTLHPSERWSMTRCETLTAHTDKVLSVTYAPNRNEFASGSNDIRLWTGIRGSEGTTWSSRFDWSINQVACLSYTFDGALLAANSYREIKFWDLNTGEDNGSLKGHKKFVTTVASSPSNYMMVSGSRDKTVLLWDPRVMEQVGSPLVGHTGLVTSVAFSRGGEVVASASADKTVRLWDIRVGRCIGKLSGFTEKATAASFSPDGRHIAAASDDGTICRWNVHTLERLGTTLRGHQAPIKCLAFSPDGTQIASGSADMMIRMWDASTGANVGLPLEGHRGTIESIAFSPDGDKMVSGARDKTVKVWSAAH